MAHEFVIKNGFISKGDSIVSGSLSGDTLNLTTIPSNDNSQTQVLVRNNTTGLVEYRDASTFSGASDTNTIVTGFTYNDNNTFTINDNAGSAFTATINQVSGLTVNGTLSATTLDGSTIFSGGTNLLTIIEGLDTYVTGGTYSDITDVITFTNTNGVPFNVTGVTDTFVTGFTWNPSTFDLTIGQNNGITDETVNLSILSSDVYVLSGVYSASTGVVTYTNSTGGTFQVSGFTTGMTDSYTVSANLNSESIEFVNNLQTPSPFYSVSLTPLLSGKTNNTTFNTYTSDTQTTLNTKISGATNLSTTGIFGQKNGQNLEFKGITSTGGTVTITNDSTTVNLDVTIPVDTNTFVTGGTYNPSTVNLDFSGNSGFSSFSVDVSDLKDDTNTFVTGYTYDNNNTFTISDNNGSAFTATINQVSGLTVNGILSATTYTGITLNSLDDVTSNIPATPDNTYQGRMVYFDVASNEWLSTEEYVSTGTVTIWGKKGSAGAIDKGLPVYVVGFDDDIHEVEIANSSTGTTMPVIGFTSESFDNTNTNPIVTFGKLTGINTSSGTTTLNPNGETWVINDELYISTTTGGLTKNRPAGTDTQIQRVAKILKVGTVDGQLFVFNTARTAGLPNLTTDYLWVGNGNDTPQEIIKTDVGITTTGFTYNENNTFTISDNTGSAFTATINQVSGLTVNGTLSATTLYGNTILSGGTNLLSIIDDRDNFVTGTTFGSNQSVTTTKDGVDILQLSGGTNVTLSNPSGNQIKIDVSSSIDTGNVLWVDNIFGNDGTALVDRQDKPWSSIATAIGNATTNDTIMVRPGDYVEPPFTLIPSTSLISQGGPKVTFISGSTTGNFITVSGSSYMEGFTLYTPTDDSAALYFNDPTGGIVTSFHNVHFKGSSVSGGTGVTLGKGLVMDSGLGSGPPPAKIIYTELRYDGGHLDTLVEVNKGIFALDGMHVPGGQTVNKGIQANGGRLQLTNVNIGNGNCGTAISVSGTASNTPVVVGFGLNLFNVPTGLEITSNYYDIELQNGRIEAGAENLLISSGLTGEFGKLNMVNFIMDSEKIDEPYTWAASEHIIFYSDIGNSQNVSPIIRTHGNLEIGQPNRGSSLSVGRGTEYQKGMHLHSSGTTGTTNLILSATTKGVIWSFESLTAGEELYIGSSERYPNGDYVNWCGFELTYTGSTGGTYTIEYYSGGTWVDIKYQVTNQEFGYNYSNNLFHRTVGTREDVRIAVLKNNGWSESTIFGHTAKWVRITMVTPPASLPQFDLLWLEGSHTKINQNGISTYYGSALYRDTLLSAGNVFGESGGVLSAEVPVGSGGLPTGWDHSIKNSRLNGNGDAIYLQSALPRGLCSAYPLSLKIYFGLDPGDGIAITNSPELITSFLVKGASGTLVADPSGGITPLPRTIENTTTLTASTGSFVTSDLVEVGKPANTYAGKAMSIQDIEFDISESYEGDGFLLRIELNNDGTPDQDVIIFAVEVDVVKWALGERVQVE